MKKDPTHVRQGMTGQNATAQRHLCPAFTGGRGGAPASCLTAGGVASLRRAGPAKATGSSSCGGLPPHCQGPLPRGEPGCCRKPCGPMGHVPTAERQPHSRRTRGGHLDEPTRLALARLNTGFPHIQEDTGDYKAPLVLCEASLSPTNRPPPQGFLHIQTFTVKGDEPPCRASGRQMVLLNCVLKRKNRRGASGRSVGRGLTARADLRSCCHGPASVRPRLLSPSSWIFLSLFERSSFRFKAPETNRIVFPLRFIE